MPRSVDHLVVQGIEGAPAGIGIVDAGCRLVYANACLTAFLAAGHAAADLAGPALPALAPHLAGEVAALVARVLRSGQPVEGVEMAGSGRTRWATSWRPLPDESGRPLYVALLATDITELVAAREAVQRSEAQTLELQRALVPVTALAFDELSVAVRRPASGSCWCDVLDLGAGRLGIAVGDVAAQGHRAAAVAGQLRTAVRTCARRGLRPDEILDLLDGLVAEMDGVEADCLYAVFDPHTRDLELACAGQPPPVLRSPAGGAEVLSVDPSPALGRGDAARTMRVPLPAGGVLALHTRGLTAGRTDSPTGVLALAAALVHGPHELEALADALESLAGDGAPDHVLLLLQLPADIAARSRSVALPVPRDRVRAAEVRECVRGAGQQWALLPDVTDLAVLIASELVTNALVHAVGDIEVRLRLTRDRLVVEVGDQSHQLPRRHGLREQDERGRGLHLVSMLAHRWGSRPTDQGKVVWAELDLAGS